MMLPGAGLWSWCAQPTRRRWSAGSRGAASLRPLAVRAFACRSTPTTETRTSMRYWRRSTRSRPWYAAGRATLLSSARAILEDHRGSLDLDLRPGFDQAAHNHDRHGRKVPADNLAVAGADFPPIPHVRVPVRNVPNETSDLVRTSARRRERRDDVRESLAHLVKKLVAVEL